MTFNWHALLKIIADHVTEQANAAVEFVAQNVTDETHENKLVFDLHLAVNGEKVDHTDFGEGSGEVEVDLPLDGLEVPEGKTVKIVYVDDNGGRHDMGGEFDRHNHRVKFKTHHFSTYEAVIEEEDAQETVAVTVENMTNGVASVNAPAGTVGEAYTLTVSAEMACVVLVQDSEGNYEPLVATSVGDNTYSFTTVLEEGMTFVVAVKGDISLDSVVDGVDAARAALYFAQKITLDAVTVAVGDLDGDNVITGVDAARAALAFAKKITIAW